MDEDSSYSILQLESCMEMDERECNVCHKEWRRNCRTRIWPALKWCLSHVMHVHCGVRTYRPFEFRTSSLQQRSSRRVPACSHCSPDSCCEALHAYSSISPSDTTRRLDFVTMSDISSVSNMIPQPCMISFANIALITISLTQNTAAYNSFDRLWRVFKKVGQYVSLLTVSAYRRSSKAGTERDVQTSPTLKLQLDPCVP